MVNHDVQAYYSEHPATSFALQVWVNNSWVAAKCIAMSVVLGLPIPLVLFQNAANLGLIGGLMFQAGRGRCCWACSFRTGCWAHRRVPGRGNRDAAWLVGDFAG